MPWAFDSSTRQAPVRNALLHVYDETELVASDNTVFVATRVTDGNVVSGVRRRGRGICTDHVASKWL
ncbi:fructose-bisphosphatase class II [Microbacterium saperdae]